MNRKLSLLAFGLLFSLPSQAETKRQEKRNENQQNRIEQGQASGQLTDKEAAHLEKQQDRIHTAQENASADGTVTRGERKKINHMQNHASQRIKHQKHDRQRK